MQLYAIDKTDSVVGAWAAQRGADYCCLECRHPVRVRFGQRIRPHFYHLRGHRPCAQANKSLIHLQIQWRLQQMLPYGAIHLEVPFRSRGRIADAVWESERLIYEVQCSGITAAEVRSRNYDYGVLGYDVIWILHTRQFGGKLFSGAEKLLLFHTHYFTNIDREGKGVIYDQFSCFDKGRRVDKRALFPVDLREPIRTPKALAAPWALQERARSWALSFRGDLLDSVMKGQPLDLPEPPPVEIPAPLLVRLGQCVWRAVCDAYTAVFRLMLEKACR